MDWEKLCPHLSFIVENKMVNSYKRGWLHFKYNINDGDITFPKILWIGQWNGKNIFSIGETEWTHRELPYDRIFGQ